MSLTIEQILASPEYYPLKFEGPNLVFVRMSRESYEQSIFTLPNRIVTQGQQAWAVPLGDIVRMVEEADNDLPSPKLIFQIAHCGSTLLSRAIDQAGHSLVIREPFALRQLTATPLSPNPAENKDRTRALKAVWYLLSRQFQSNETVIIKGNVPVNYAISELLEATSLASAVFLYSEFDDYMVAALKSDERRQWAQHVVQEMSPRIRSLAGFENIDAQSLSAANAVAVLWLSQINIYESMIRANTTMKSLSSKQLTDHPDMVLSACNEYFGLDIDASKQDSILQSKLFKRHAKNLDIEFSIEEHRANLIALKHKYEDEINDVREWCTTNQFVTSTSLEKSKLV